MDKGHEHMNCINSGLQWRSQDLKILQAYGRASAIGASVSRGVREIFENYAFENARNALKLYDLAPCQC